MKTRRYLAVCLVAGGLAFGVGSAASWLLSRTASATGGDGAFAQALLPELVPAVLDVTVDASGTTRTIHVVTASTIWTATSGSGPTPAGAATGPQTTSGRGRTAAGSGF